MKYILHFTTLVILAAVIGIIVYFAVSGGSSSSAKHPSVAASVLNVIQFNSPTEPSFAERLVVPMWYVEYIYFVKSKPYKTYTVVSKQPSYKAGDVVTVAYNSGNPLDSKIITAIPIPST